MNTAAPNETWSRTRLAGVGVAVFAGHFACVWLLGAKVPEVPQEAPLRPLVRWIAGPLDAPTIAAAMLVEDPSLGVGPSLHGFSAVGWLRLPGPPAIETVWAEPVRHLDPRLESFGDALLATNPTNTPAAPAFGHRSAVDQVLARPRLASEPVRPKSTWELSGPLRMRLSHGPGEPPAWENLEPLRDTRLDLRVDSEGVVQGVRLRESSGLAAADQWAIAAAWKLSFAEATATAAPFEDGQLVYYWRTIPRANPAGEKP